LTIETLVSREHETSVTEIILALNATVDGQTTAHYITELLHDANVKVTRLAHGVPVGSELDYLDEGTLAGGIKQPTLFYPSAARSGSCRLQPFKVSALLQPGQQQQAWNAGQHADHKKPDPTGPLGDKTGAR